MTEKKPKVSVLMSVYNAQDDLPESIESILNQTFKDFEFIIVNDGSTDQSEEILREYAAKDRRIKLINQENTGLTKALNTGIKCVQGEFVARQDADDTSYPKRLEKQLKAFESDADILLIGSNCDDVYEDGSTGQWGAHSPNRIKAITLRQTPFAHSTAIMRTDTLNKLDGYDESYRTAQDMELWMRFAKEGKILMLQEPLIQRKIVSTSISAKKRKQQFYDATKARWKHNSGLHKIVSQFYGVRSVIINILPLKFIKFVKGSR